MDKKDVIKKEIKSTYGYIATQKLTGRCCCNGNAADYTGVAGHQKEADYSLGCGLPTEIANIKEGDTVLDLGCGAGNDVFVAREIVGETGKVIGLDMTPEMINRAMENNHRLGYKNINFVLGEIENMQNVSDQTIDVVISNCVMNLVPDKEKAFKDIFRILKPKGHFSISDIVYTGSLPTGVLESAEVYASCIAGASEKNQYLNIIENAGFENVQIKKERLINVPEELLLKYIDTKELNKYKQSESALYSITVYAEKPSAVKEIEYLKPDTPQASVFPATGHKYEVDYGDDFVVQFIFNSVNSLSIFGMKGKYKDFTETVEISVTPIRLNVFIVAWKEENQTVVVHVEDFEKNIIYANITLPGNSQLRLRGNLKQLD